VSCSTLICPLTTAATVYVFFKTYFFLFHGDSCRRNQTRSWDHTNGNDTLGPVRGCTSTPITLIERNPPPRGGFVFQVLFLRILGLEQKRNTPGKQGLTINFTWNPRSYILHITLHYLHNTSISTYLHIHYTPQSCNSQVRYQHTPLQNNIHVSRVHCGSVFAPGACGPPYYCTPLVCVLNGLRWWWLLLLLSKVV